MSTFADLAASANDALLAVHGDSITYIPNKGTGDPITTTAILAKPEIEQSASPGYFADLRLDPLQITAPLKGDQVVWTDGVTYTVAKIARPKPFGLFIVSIHRTFDP